jgi:predicted enzyme related to lactoylglutathione lyase
MRPTTVPRSLQGTVTEGRDPMSPISTMSLLIEADEPLTLARFWADVFGVAVAPGSDPASASLVVHARSPQLVFQKSDEPKMWSNRVKLRLVTEDLDEQLLRLLDMGVHVTHASTGGGGIELCDPEGNEFHLLPRVRIP